MAARNPGVFVVSPSFRALLAPRFNADILSFFRATPGQDGLNERETTRSLHFATVYCVEDIDKKGIHDMWSQIRTEHLAKQCPLRALLLWEVTQAYICILMTFWKCMNEFVWNLELIFSANHAITQSPKRLLYHCHFFVVRRFCKIKVHIPCFFLELPSPQNQISISNSRHFYVKHVTNHTSAALGTKVKDIQQGSEAYFCTSHSATPTIPRRKNVPLLCLWLHKYMKNWCSKKYVDKTMPQESYNSRRIEWI